VGRDGRPYRVIYRGRAGLGPGPDFRDAIVAGPAGLLSGDVELHVRASDFRRHGHADDPAYNRVVLHVVLIDDVGWDTPLPGGGVAPVATLGAGSVGRWLLRPPRGQEPCRTAVIRLGAGGTAAALDRLGMMRFRQKTAVAGKRLAAGEDPDQILWQGILEALGYGGDREAFARLAGAAPWHAIRRSTATLSAGTAAGAANALLVAAYEQASGGRAPPSRPGNTPAVRLQAAAALAARFRSEGPSGALRSRLVAGRPKERLLRFLIVARVLGRARAVEVLANAVLPALAAGGLDREAKALFATLPLPARYGSVRHLHSAVGAAVQVNARRQQGMLYLLSQHCTRGGCGRCPLS
jgi:hypothetical protein